MSHNKKPNPLHYTTFSAVVDLKKFSSGYSCFEAVSIITHMETFVLTPVFCLIVATESLELEAVRNVALLLAFVVALYLPPFNFFP